MRWIGVLVMAVTLPCLLAGCGQPDPNRGVASGNNAATADAAMPTATPPLSPAATDTPIAPSATPVLPAPTTGGFALDDSGPSYAPTDQKLSCATVSNPAAVVTVFQSDTSDPAPTCASKLLDGFSWANPAVPNHTLVCTADNLYETAKVYTALGSDDYSKLLCQTIAKNQAYTVTYP